MADENKDPLYHYTSGAGLLGILTTGELWFSDPRFLNDSQEWKWAGQIISRTIAELARGYRPQFLARGCRAEEVDAFIKQLVGYFQNPPIPVPGNGAYSRPFIFSFTTLHNSLSQWRAYGNGEYCIAFDTAKLEEAGLKPVSVEYNLMEADERTRSRVSNMLDNALRSVTNDGRIHYEVRSESAPYLHSLLATGYFLRQKSPGFIEENEFRVIVEADSSNIEFRGGAYPTPYIARKIFNMPRGAPAEKNAKPLPQPREIITEIMCGPGMDIERAQASIDMINFKYGLGLRPAIKSDIAFRQKPN